MNKLLLKNITNFVGIAAIFVAGTLYVLLADILLTVQSIWLILVFILSIGSAVCFLLADNFREKIKTMLTLKGIAVGLSVLFIGYCVMYLLIAMSPAKDLTDASAFVKSFAIKRIEDSYTPKKDTVYNLAVAFTSIGIAVVGIVAQVWNIVLTVKLKDEE